ncbi:MAG: molecular chaperone DnaJ [Bacteroidetes bacterium]|nr:molecular chaperone DnaJ [Bacteroidota bacterium]
MNKLLVFSLLLIYAAALGQSVQYDPDVTKHYNAGVESFENGQFDEANKSFRRALSTNKVLPTNLSYYFAETLYHLGQHQNSKNFVDKYLSLAGYGGDFYEEASFLLELLETEFDAIKNCDLCNVFGYRLNPCDQCEASGIELTSCHQCNGVGNTICPKCMGKGVLITVDAFNQSHYEECDKCSGDGHIVCELCAGNKVITRICVVCLGTKLKSSTIICNHEDHQESEFFQKKKIYRQ